MMMTTSANLIGSVNCVPWVYVPELLPLEARTRGTAIGVSSNWLWNFTVVMITPIIINRLEWKAYLIFMATNLAFIPIVYFFYRKAALKPVFVLIHADTAQLKLAICD
jgi:RsiW-degrading membrane proteinase PrsW (M82 family)